MTAQLTDAADHLHIMCANWAALSAATDSISPSWRDHAQGPPGTGKTSTIARLLIMLANCGQRVLATAPTNVAIAEVAQRCARFLCCNLALLLLCDSKWFVSTAIDVSMQQSQFDFMQGVTHTMKVFPCNLMQGVQPGSYFSMLRRTCPKPMSESTAECLGRRACRVWSLAALKPETQFGAFADREGIRLPPGSQRRDLLPGDLVLVVSM